MKGGLVSNDRRKKGTAVFRTRADGTDSLCISCRGWFRLDRDGVEVYLRGSDGRGVSGAERDVMRDGRLRKGPSAHVLLRQWVFSDALPREGCRCTDILEYSLSPVV